jgi:arylsulfatase A-like enzyme
VGHAYGPDSPQLLDTLRRLDARLDDFLRLLDRRIGLEHVVVALSSDHGVVPIPEARTEAGLPGRRVDRDDVLCMQRVRARLEGRFGAGAWLRNGPFVDRELARARGISPEAVERAAAEVIAECPSVSRVWTRSELLAEGIEEDPVGRLFAHSFHRERGPDLFVQHDEYFLDSRRAAASHGTPWAYDTHVPLVLMVPGAPPARISRRVRTVDLAPTLARLVDVTPTGPIDGVPLELDGR